MSPDKVFGPKLANLFQSYAEVIYNESKATSIKINAEFTYTKGKGDLKMKTYTSPDAKTERMLDPDKPMARGSSLQHEVDLKLKSAFNKLTKSLGGK